MKKSLIWTLMLVKRQLKKISFYIVLLIMIVSCFFIRFVGNNMTASIEIGISSADKSEMAEKIVKDLLEHKGIVNFIVYPTKESLEKAVRKGDVKGGYFFEESFGKNLLEKKANDTVKVLETPDNTIAIITNEIVFSAVMKELSFEILAEDTLDTGYFSQDSEDKIRNDLRKFYDVNLINGSTFHVNYEGGTFQELKEYGKSSEEIYDYISPMIIGIVGILIFLAGLSGGINYYEDRERGTFALMKISYIQLVGFVEIYIPVFLTSVAGAFILWATKMEDSFIKAMGVLFLYSFIVGVYTFIMTKLIKNKLIYVGVIPVIILISALFCPVFLDISTVLPSAVYINKLLPLSFLV